MKLNITLVLIIQFFILKVNSQRNFYNDANKLNEIRFDKDKDKKLITLNEQSLTIILPYFNIDTADLFNRINSNPFLKDKFIKNSSTSNIDLSNLSNIASQVSRMDVTTIADGLAMFLAERAKEELNIAFFDKFREELKLYPELGKSFPSTTYFLTTIINYNYAHVLPTLREAFLKDLENLPNNLSSLALLDSTYCNEISKENKRTICKDRIKKLQTFFNTNEGASVIIALKLSQAAINKQTNPINIINDMALATNGNSEISNILKLTNIIANAFVCSDCPNGVISKTQISELLKNENLLQIFVGLIYQEILNNNIQIGNLNFTVSEEKQQVFSNIIRSYCIHFSEIYQYAILIQEDKNSSLKANHVSNLLSEIQKLLLLSSEWKNINVKFQLSPVALSVFKTTDLGLSLSTHILNKNYYGAILDASQILNVLFNVKTNEKNKLLDNSLYANQKLLQDFTRYGTFLSDVVQAKDAKEVKEAIKAAALPPGSSSIKKNTYFSIALQAYVGGTIGGTFKDKKPDKSQLVIAPYAPIGVSFSIGLKSWKYSNNKVNAGSLSLMAQLIDIGAMVAYRLDNPDSSLPEKVKVRFENIFAPGLSLVYGIPKVPISIGGGFQWQPSAYGKIDYTKYAVLNGNSGIRGQIFIAVDIPMFNLFTTQK